MSPDLYQLLERVHGHLAVLGLALLTHPIVTLARRRGLPVWTLRSAELSCLLLAAPFAIGWWIYPTYRADLRPLLWADHPWAARAFESKEHLAAMALALVLGGALTLRASGRMPDGRRAGHALLAGGWLCGVAAGALGIWVASVSA